MNILTISTHNDLVERLRTAFEGAGHRVITAADPLQALAGELWNRAHLILVDAVSDPMDGYRFSRLLRGESRVLFQNLPIFIILDHPPTEEDLQRIREADLDGYIGSADGFHRLMNVLGPALEGNALRTDAPRVPLITAGLRQALTERVRVLVSHYGFEVTPCSLRQLPETLQHTGASLCLLGIDPAGQRVIDTLERLRETGPRCYPVVLGGKPSENLERRLFLAGAMDWFPLPLSSPRLLHACRRGMEWIHGRRVQEEFQQHLNDLKEQRVLLEMEAASLRNEVLTDPLTGLLNRRAFTQNLEHSFNQWLRNHRHFVLLLGDLDYFKLINDRFGHLAGDQVLKGIAQRFRAGLRRSDLAFRIGGEEFAILLPETGLQAGAEVAEKLRRRIDESPIRLETGQMVFPTMSFGVGGPEANADPEALFALIDQALYEAKHQGRNRIEVLKGI